MHFNAGPKPGKNLSGLTSTLLGNPVVRIAAGEEYVQPVERFSTGRVPVRSGRTHQATAEGHDCRAATRMSERVLDRNAGALRKPDDEDLVRAQAAVFARVLNQPMASIHGTGQEWLVGFQRLHESSRVPQASVGVRRDPAGAAGLKTGGQVQHFLFGAGAAMEQNPGAVREPPGLTRLAEADHWGMDCHDA